MVRAIAAARFWVSAVGPEDVFRLAGGIRRMVPGRSQRVSATMLATVSRSGSRGALTVALLIGPTYRIRAGCI